MKKIEVKPAKYSRIIRQPSQKDLSRKSDRFSTGWTLLRAQRDSQATNAASRTAATTRSSHFPSPGHCWAWTNGSSSARTPAPSSRTPTGSRSRGRTRVADGVSGSSRRASRRQTTPIGRLT